MNSFELNKIMGALLGTCLALLVMNIAAGAVFAPKKVEKPGFEIVAKEPEKKEAGGAASAEASEPIETLLASASAERGMAAAKKCGACHSFEKGGGNKVGPNLYGVVGRDHGVMAGFNYSGGMKAKPGKWDFDALNQFITSPKAYMPGTAMAFAGIGKASERADVIEYLRTLSDSPVAKPAVAEKK